MFILCKFISGTPYRKFNKLLLEKEDKITNQKMDEENRQFIQSIRLKALNNIQRSLESLSSVTANSLMLKTALESSESEEKNEEEENELLYELNTTKRPVNEEENFSTFSSLGLRRVRADLRKIPLITSTSSYELKEEEIEEFKSNKNILSSTIRAETSLNILAAPTRKHRSAINIVATQQKNLKNNGGHHQHHRRRRKGCPQIHGKDQLLCPTKNSYKYDVCITREQICDRIKDCPGGEDEDSKHCFFFRPVLFKKKENNN
ncbi:hypothetical protein Mgra_00000723 [Meloidogyne graminicola]|uniref:Uncharacterized protein n=1 Tax=Meloidogyne graminicola TaxID=189291 RepID=A0A8T0A4E1_9BILA|nr:hypothetical protein Mgra_00000723 [Meloidogyne graminicola]